MGVKNLWEILTPVARPVQLDSLRQRRLAIDASIWLYHFLKAVRDKEGNALKNAHIRERRQRRSERAKDLKKTAERILETQLKFKAIGEAEKRAQNSIASGDVNDVLAGNYTYLDELQAAAAKSRKFRKDPYELPEDTGAIAKAKKELDPRFATDEELRDFILEFKPSDLDVDSDMFRSLPTELQYEIIQDLKLKSRQTSWARLDEMIRKSRTSLDFSKQQIHHLMHRNVMTQRLLDVNSTVGNETKSQPVRIASERGRQYVLVKNEDLKAGLGWKLPGANDGAGTQDQPILAEELDNDHDNEAEDEEDEESKDKVLAAIQNNASLQRLLKSMGSRDNDNEPEDHDREELTDASQLFVQNRADQEASLQDTGLQTDILDNMGAYVDDDMTVEEVMARFHSKQELDDKLKQQHQNPYRESTPPVRSSPKPVIDDLSGPELTEYWISNTPDAFIYEHSLNDEYKNIIHDAVYNQSVEELETNLTSLKRKLDKVASHDEIRKESLMFYKRLLEETSAWKLLQVQRLEAFNNAEEASDQDNIPNPTMTWDDSDDEFEALDYSLLEEPSEALSSVNFSVKSQDNHNVPEIVSPSNGHIPETLFSTEQSFLKEDGKPIAAETTLAQSPPADALNQSNDDIPEEKEVVPLEVESSDDEDWQAVNVDHTEIDAELAISNTPDTSLSFGAEMEEDESIQHEDLVPDQFQASPMIIVENESFGDKIKSPDFTKTDVPPSVTLDNANHIDIKEEPSPVPVNEIDVSITDTEEAKLAFSHEQEGYDSDAELGTNLEEEDKEYARFVSEFGSKDFAAARQEANEDLIALAKDQRKQKRDMDELTTQMIEDAQELLRLFGIPYIISPMEAEAQCAELIGLSLVDGVVTDDSDVFLFGASKVYKNVFNQEKYVECYVSNDIQQELSLGRERLIQLAYLLGSDYTTGFAGVGQVAAMEILKEFQDDVDDDPLGPLKRFKEWWETPIAPKDEKNDFRKRFRKRHNGMEMPEDFPNPHVREAYLSPHVDSSTQEFEWGMPDLDGLRRFLYSMLGWDEKKVDDLVIPVIKEINSRKATAQASIGRFFDVSIDKPISQPTRKRTYKSKRMQNVVQSLRQRDSQANEKNTKKRSTSGDIESDGQRSSKRR
ncbi:DNA repair protein rad2 [Umbelopsis sp. WA50703]